MPNSPHASVHAVWVGPAMLCNPEAAQLKQKGLLGGRGTQLRLTARIERINVGEAVLTIGKSRMPLHNFGVKSPPLHTKVVARDRGRTRVVQEGFQRCSTHRHLPRGLRHLLHERSHARDPAGGNQLVPQFARHGDSARRRGRLYRDEHSLRQLAGTPARLLAGRVGGGRFGRLANDQRGSGGPTRKVSFGLRTTESVAPCWLVETETFQSGC